MKIIISPAKKLNIENLILNKQMQFNFTKEASVLINILQNKSVKDIKQLMSLSDNLATLNWQRYQQWALSNIKTYHAILMFNGDVYQGIKAETIWRRLVFELTAGNISHGGKHVCQANLFRAFGSWIDFPKPPGKKRNTMSGFPNISLGTTKDSVSCMVCCLVGLDRRIVNVARLIFIVQPMHE